jgi:hypothetical protein
MVVTIHAVHYGVNVRPDQPYTREQVADAFVDFALRFVGGPLPRG